jgi:hypothetical protein
MSHLIQRSMRVQAIRRKATRLARDAGLDINTACAVAQSVLDRMTPHCDVDKLIRRVIQEHAQP